MIIVQKDNVYLVLDSDGNIILSADSTDKLYAQALEILQAFAHPIQQSVISSTDAQKALDILVNRYTG